jgi:hypothetical protein
MDKLTHERRDLYFMYMNMNQVYKYLSECVQNNSDSELRQELLHRIENECAIMREDYDEKICRVTTRIDSLLRDPR